MTKWKRRNPFPPENEGQKALAALSRGRVKPILTFAANAIAARYAEHATRFLRLAVESLTEGGKRPSPESSAAAWANECATLLQTSAAAIGDEEALELVAWLREDTADHSRCVAECGRRLLENQHHDAAARWLTRGRGLATLGRLDDHLWEFGVAELRALSGSGALVTLQEVAKSLDDLATRKRSELNEDDPNYELKAYNIEFIDRAVKRAREQSQAKA